MWVAFGLLARKLIAVAVISAIAVIFGFAAPASAQTKVALVIGNGAYRNVPQLPNPPNDATDVAAAFLRLGFSVRLLTDATYDDIRKAFLEFTRKARDSEMAVVFFAGHGMETGGENWLVPIDAELKTDLDTEQEAISLRAIMLTVSAASKLGLVVLDACRNNPFLAKMKRTIATRSASRGLVRIEPMNNVLIAYAAKDGTTAADGDSRNSPFTAALLKHLEKPGLEINFLFRNVRDDVIAATDSEQEPFVYGSLSKEAIYLRPPVVGPIPGGTDQVAWSVLKETTDAAALKRFAAQYPNSPLRQDAEARVAALEAAQAAKPGPPSPDEVMWMLLKDTTDQAALRRFTSQYPDSRFRQDAETRVAALEATKAPAIKPVDARELARSLQFELKRVGCFTGTVNGEFDDATRAAWYSFGKAALIKLPDEETLDAVKAVRAAEARVCPLVCSDGERAKGDRCVAIAPQKEPAKKGSAEQEPPRKRITKTSGTSHPTRSPATAGQVPFSSGSHGGSAGCGGPTTSDARGASLPCN